MPGSAEQKGEKMKSIIQDEKKCFVTGSERGLHKHHIFGGYNRDNSERYGLWIWLRWDRHIADSPHRTPHNDIKVDLLFKKTAQRKFEEVYGHEEFMRIFGKNYL